MSAADWYDFFFKDWLTILEWIGVIFGILCVALNARENILGWPTGLISVGIYIYIFLQARLYADTVLNGFFFVTGLYGWYQWYYGGDQVDDLPVTGSTLSAWVKYIAIGIAGLLVIGWFFDTYTDADLAYWDAYTTSFSLVAQVLMARKKIENWIIWIAVDLVAVGIYWYKDLKPTAILFLIYLGLATWGYLNWQKKLVSTTELTKRS